MEKRRRHIARMLLLLFAVFYCGNIVFVHAHFDEDTDRIELHCHPYIPGTNHSHTHQQLASIRELQAEMVVMDVPELIVFPHPIHSTKVVYQAADFAAFGGYQGGKTGRAPPCIG